MIGVFFSSVSSAQNLVGIIDEQLVLINNSSAETQVLREVAGMPNGTRADLTYSQQNDLYYGLINTSTTPSLISITPSGSYTNIGRLTISGTPLVLAEAIAYNSADQKVYISASLNGGVSSGDFYSESILEVNTSDATCSLVTQISTSKPNPDIDVMGFENNILYLMDGAPPGINFNVIYSLDFSGLASNSSPLRLFEGSYLPVRDLTIIENQIYFTENRNLRRYTIGANSIEFIGSTHFSSEFSGELIHGLTNVSFECFSPIVDLGQDMTVCENSPVQLDATFGDATYLWQDGSSDPVFEVTQSGQYWVEIRNVCGFDRDTIQVSFEPEIEIDLGADQKLCTGTQVILDATFFSSTYEWNNGVTNPVIEVFQSGIYWVDVENACGIVRDSIEIIFEQPVDLELGQDLIICNESHVSLDATSPNATYLWNDGSSNSTLNVSETGTYWVSVMNDCNMQSDTISIVIESMPVVDLGEDLEICNEEPIMLDVTFPDSRYTWQDGSSEPFYEICTSGVYWVLVENDCGIARDTVKYNFIERSDVFIPNVFSPNGDNINDVFEIDEQLLGASLKIFQRTGVLVFESPSYHNEWDGGGILGTFYYHLRDNCENEYSGWVTILK